MTTHLRDRSEGRWWTENVETEKGVVGVKDGIYTGGALAFVVVVNPMVSLISRPAAIRFALRSTVSPVGRYGNILSHPLTYSSTTFTLSHPRRRQWRRSQWRGQKIPAVSQEKQSGKDFSVSSPETEHIAREMIYLCFLLLELRLGSEWNSTNRIFYCATGG